MVEESRRRVSKPPVLFVQGGGAGVHDDWDHRLVQSLRDHLGEGYDVRYPRMPAEHDPSLATWGPAIREALDALPEDGVAVGHSVGGTLLVQTLAEHPRELTAVVLIAPPYVGDGGWPGDEFAFDEHLGERLPAEIHLFWGTADDTVPEAHLQLFARAVPRAELHRLEGRDHQLADDLSEVAATISTLTR